MDHIFLASDYGNFWLYLTSFPILAFSLLIGFFCRQAGVRILAVICGLICIGMGIRFLLSLDTARADGYITTIIFGIGSLIAGGMLIFWKRKEIQ